MKNLIGYLLIGLILNSSSAFAGSANVGDHIYVVEGSGSDAYVWSGTVIVAGESRSKIDWDSCSISTCGEWIYNSSMYYSRSTAQQVADKMDAEHTSVGEAAGAVGLGLIGLFVYGALCATDPKTGKPINEGCK